MGAVPDPAVSIHFNIRISGFELGGFTGFDGISAEYEVLPYPEGGENTYVHQLPGRLKYVNFKLTRPVDENSNQLGVLFSMLSKGLEFGVRHVATVVARNSAGDDVAEWVFDGAYPVKYTGPSFTVDTGKVATETYEFAHKGLLAVTGAVAGAIL